MATERVYSPETCEPFDVPASKAASLVLDKGWTRTPWTREAVPVVEPEPVVVDEVDEPEAEAEPARGRGRRRRTTVAAPVVDEDEGDEPSDDVDAAEPWRS